MGAPLAAARADAPRAPGTLAKHYAPRTPLMVMEADLVVSLPKMKTHHWAGITVSMKNLFGIVPGAIYGWPKNLLHWEGIEDSILDINAALRVPRFNIVDGIVGMEGNGPIQGDVVDSGLLVLGADPVAVDATVARLMSIDPTRIDYLARANVFLGNLDEEKIEQLGENPDALRRDFVVLESFRKAKQRSTGS